jgi:hypothetical protein
MCCFNNGCCRRNCRCNNWCNRNHNRWPCDREIRESYENSCNEGYYRRGQNGFDPDNNFNDNFSDNFSDNFRDNFSRNFNDNFSNNLNDNFSNNFSDNFSNNEIFIININVDDNIEV